MDKLVIKNTVFGDGTARICVPIVDATKQEIILRAKEIAVSKADVVEWRCDFFENYKDISLVVEVLKELAQILKDKPIIFTFRTSAEGGNQTLSTAEYSLLYKTAILSRKVDFVDIEIMRLDEVVTNVMKHAKSNGIYVILSNHDMNATPPADKLIQRIKRMEEKGATISKIACMPRSEKDVQVMKDIALQLKPTNLLFIAISMGELGVSTRVQASELGSCMTFASFQNESAPGQVALDKLI